MNVLSKTDIKRMVAVFVVVEILSTCASFWMIDRTYRRNMETFDQESGAEAVVLAEGIDRLRSDGREAALQAMYARLEERLRFLCGRQKALPPFGKDDSIMSNPTKEYADLDRFASNHPSLEIPNCARAELRYDGR